MQEIANISGGISRERVRQLLHRNGVSGAWNGDKTDALKVLRVCRRGDVRNWNQVASPFGGGTNGHKLRELISPLGMVPAIDRLFAWRQRKARALARTAIRDELLQEYRSLAARLGHVPGSHELVPKNGTRFWTQYMRHFNGMRELRVAAGLDATDHRATAKRKRRVSCQRGHLFAETRNKWGQCSECIRLRKCQPRRTA